jgi:LPXTG-site transpeptidase (sortase) family protein
MSAKQLLIYAAQVLGIFTATFIVLYVFGLVPESLRPSREVVQAPAAPQKIVRRTDINDAEATIASETRPSRVIIPKIGVDSTIQHPQSPNVDVLDAALTKGAVYYPGSGTIEQGNVFLFGHSTNWQIVRNDAYKTFNDLDKLKTGDIITIWGEDGEIYKYSVETVTLANENTAFVSLDTNGRRLLTISTCNSFGAKQDRWVVQAVFAGKA